MFEVSKISDTVRDGRRTASFQTCDCVCSQQIDITLDGERISEVRFTKGCHGNTQGIARLCVGRTPAEVIGCLEGIDCKARGTSCPDQLARALRQLL